MSAEATLAVMEHAKGTDGEWRMLAVMANAANPYGIVMGVGAAELAERCGKTERGVGQMLANLRKSEQLVVLHQGGGRGRTNIYWINLPGLPAPSQTPNEDVLTQAPNPETNGDTPVPDAGNGKGPPISSKTTTSSRGGKAGKEEDFLVALFGDPGGVPEDAVDAETVADAIALLGQGKKVDGKVVTPAEMAIAAAAVGAFNRCFEWNGKLGADYGLGANLTSIVMRARDRPSWEACKHVRLVESAWRVRWWEQNGRSNRRPHPNVIYGAKSFENVVQDAAYEAGGESPTAIKKRRYTRG